MKIKNYELLTMSKNCVNTEIAKGKMQPKMQHTTSK